MKLRTLTIAALLMLAVACGGDAVTAPMVTSVPPTSAPFAAPTLVGGFAGISSADSVLLGLGRLKDTPPPELDISATRLDGDEVPRIWTDWMVNTRHVLADGDVIEYCENGVGTELFNEFSLSATFTWSVATSPGSRWNVGKLTFAPDDVSTSRYGGGGIVGEAGFSWPLDPSRVSEDGLLVPDFGGDLRILVFESVGCGQ